MKVVISQPMFFPWVGLFEQIELADTYVHLDDVQLPQGRSFISRVQIKTPMGTQWLSVPVKRGKQLINEVTIDDSQPWRDRHLQTLAHNYARAPFGTEMLEIARSVYALKTSHLSELNCFAIEAVARYYDIVADFRHSSAFGVQAVSSEKLIRLLQHLNGGVYITGHGARNYLDHTLLEAHDIRVEYMDYQKLPYPQLYGEFTPYVSILDLIANTGRDGRMVITSGTVHWREFVK